jgi:heterodisulfide reductase subunit A
LFPDRRASSEIIEYLNKQSDHSNITLRSGYTAESVTNVKNKVVVSLSGGEKIDADAVIVSTGFDLFRSERKEEYGYGIYDNVITSADLEKMFRDGKIVRHDGTEPKRIGFIHCVGSRDEKVGNIYCSKLCCVTAVKQAIEVKEHLNDSKVWCFYMDMRMGGAHYEELYMESQRDFGINYIRGKVSEVSENIDNRLIVKVEDTLTGRPLRMELDMLVLMAGMENSVSGASLANRSSLPLGENGFFVAADAHTGSNVSPFRGIFYAGACTAPMNVPETIAHARGAAIDVINYLRNN